ncbi:hypothetical protein BDV30DRAFT_237267 [Aspergillus minisclerotigenes]|uniref:Uncharacterized protein n=1 Tax=Aspergillus minisclerotigenes TaxID=656917 RepID=A0A5N6J7T1_9EURO|nr:hypothetical protein BDV30DRAFT_237267 [Aspergillus minisclerotigenes]
MTSQSAHTVRRAQSIETVLQRQPTTLEPTPLETNTPTPDRDQFADHHLNLLHPARNIERCGTPVPFYGEEWAWRKDESQTSSWNSPGPNHQGVMDSMTGMVGEASGSHEFFGSSSAGSFRRQMQHTIDSRLRCCHNSADFGITEVGPSNPGVTQSSFFTNRAIEYVLLPRKTTDQLVDAYWELVYPPHPFLDRYALGNCYESVWTGSGRPPVILPFFV